MKLNKETKKKEREEDLVGEGEKKCEERERG